MASSVMTTREPKAGTPRPQDITISFQFAKDIQHLLTKTRNQVPTMNAKICLVALFAVVATTANAQQPRLCQPACGAQHSGQNAYISSCCLQYEASVGANFDACCASSCANGNPCKWEDVGSISGSATSP